MSIFENLKKSLEEAIAYKQGKLKNVKRHTREANPLPKQDKTEEILYNKRNLK